MGRAQFAGYESFDGPGCLQEHRILRLLVIRCTHEGLERAERVLPVEIDRLVVLRGRVLAHCEAKREHDQPRAAPMNDLGSWLRRRPLQVGSLFLTFVAWYGTGRVVEDFFRIDEAHGLGLTASQWVSLAAVTVASCLLVTRLRPGRAEYQP